MTSKRERDIPLETGLPASVPTERLILGAVLRGEAFETIRGALDSQDFALEAHRRIFQRMSELHDRGETIDRVTVAQELQKHSQLESVGGITALAYLDEGLPDLVNLDAYVRIVSQKSTLRRAALACETLRNRFLLAEEAPEDVLGDAESLIRQLAARSAPQTELQSAREIIDALDVNRIGQVPRDVVTTPYASLNQHLVGFFPGELIVIGARPSAGKSAMAIEMAAHAAEAGRPVAIFSLEMRKQAIVTRIVCNRGNVDNAKVRHGRMSDVERYEFLRALREVHELPLYIDDQAHTFAAMARAVRKMQPRPRLMVVDHLHLMRGMGRSENRNNELSQITRELKLFSGEIDATVLLLAQLNRDHEKQGRPPEMRDLRDSGSIEADADVIAFLHRKQEMQATNYGTPVPVDLLLAKQREGISHIILRLMLIGKHYRFVECETERSAA